MTNKLKYFIGNWKMFGDFSSFKIIYKINQYIYKEKNFNNARNLTNFRFLNAIPKLSFEII